MKYGEQLEQDSVPEWSLHNIDYNSLKHEIKVHTTRDQATAITIPGHKDSALAKFEDNLYLELCRQHDRVDLFVGSKANEIGRRLEHIENQIQRLLVRSAEEVGPKASLKHQRKFARYERELLRCGEDTLSLGRFINAQIVAFRKITKKYKKWTGSSTLGSRFRDNVLGNPKSFTRRDFQQLQTRYDEILNTLRAATPQVSEPSSPSSDELPVPIASRLQDGQPDEVEFPPLPPPQPHYWNEYDYGSEADVQDDDGYAIYINPDEDFSFPGLDSVREIITLPFRRAREWFARGNPERRRLLDSSGENGNGNAFGASFIGGYGGISPTGTDTDDEYASSDDLPAAGYTTHYAALPSIGDQRMARYRERVLLWAMVGSFATSFILLGIAGVLLSTGRHKLRVEVDTGVVIGVMSSLLFACLALGFSLSRRDHLSISHRAAVWTTFVASCVLNGMVLILVMGITAP